MAGRSDFISATLPRYLKRMLALGQYDNDSHRAEVKKLFIQAHKAHQDKKARRMSENRRDLASDIGTTEETPSGTT